MKFINKLFRDEAGATAIEYGLIAALIAVAAIAAMQATFNSTSSSLDAAV
jgi:pilus assembly protein Flp/PilA